MAEGVRIKNSLVLGADEYETIHEGTASARGGPRPPLGIGENTLIENAIVDKNARIGRNVRIVNPNGVREHDGDSYFVREGIVIVPKGAVIADGVEI